ncbi:MAG: hypothetical protein HY698_08655 [Deltaproteobacteria bacterium]|nr:hypothetical protein [Deltaproteobacteria bacterium]
MQKKSLSKMTVTKETLRNLSANELSAVQGGEEMAKPKTFLSLCKTQRTLVGVSCCQNTYK